MAQYKVIQDIEAEDKLLGPLTLKQFIYFAITAVCLYLTFYSATQGAAFLAIILLPPAIFFGVLGFPWSKAQPTETWLLAKIRFFFKPRKRIWDQAGVKELVTVTVPKKVEQHLTDELDQTQVHSRLSALAQTVDSRGWAVKQLGGSPFGGQQVDNSDRLTTGTQTGDNQIATDVGVKEDVLDEQNNPTAQNIEKMITQSETTHKDQIKAQMTQSSSASAAKNDKNDSQPPQDFWFMHQNDPSKTPPGMATGQGTTVTPYAEPKTANNETQISKEDEEALLNKIHKSQAKKSTYTTHQKTVLPLSEQKKQKQQKTAQAPAKETKKEEHPAKPAPDPSVTQLANNNDLNVETIARQANRNKDDEHPDEVVVSLH